MMAVNAVSRNANSSIRHPCSVLSSSATPLNSIMKNTALAIVNDGVLVSTTAFPCKEKDKDALGDGE